MKFKIFTISVLIIMIITSIIYSNSVNNNRFKYISVDNLVNDSLRMIEKDSIISYLKTLNVLKDSVKINEIDLNKIENKLNEIKYVKKSNAFFGINSNLKIKIDERNPVVEINYLGAYLDDEGKVVPKSTLNNINVIKVFGKIDPLKFIEVADLGLRIAGDKFYKNHFNYVFSDSSELYIKPKIYNYTIELGNLEMLEKKLNNYKFFYASKLNEKDLEKVRTINLKFDNQVIVEKK